MFLLRGLAGTFAVLIFGGIALVAAEELSSGVLYAGVWVRVILIAALAVGGFFAGWGRRGRIFSLGIRLAAILSALTAFSFFWFVPSLWDTPEIIKIILGIFVIIIFCVYLSADIKLLSNREKNSQK